MLYRRIIISLFKNSGISMYKSSLQRTFLKSSIKTIKSVRNMPVNAPAEYFAAEKRYQEAKSREEKIAALEEMIRLIPKHHGSEAALAQLKARLAKLKKETTAKKGAAKKGVAKEGEAQVCIVGLTNSGKSTLIAALTESMPEISKHPYTTTKPVVGMADYNGVKIQLVEIPSTFDPEYISIVKSADAVVVVARNRQELNEARSILEKYYVRTKSVDVNPWEESAEAIKEKIWQLLDLIIVFTKRTFQKSSTKTVTPMALPRGSTVRDFARRIHKDFIANFRFARLLRAGMVKQVGLDYVLQNGDVVEIHAK
jgi:ribosome-interacting GTPase 1